MASRPTMRKSTKSENTTNQSTIFVKTDTQGFKELVQRLTGTKMPPTNPKKSAFKLHDTSQVYRKLEMTVPVEGSHSIHLESGIDNTLLSPNSSSSSMVPQLNSTPISSGGGDPFAADIGNCIPSSSAASVSRIGHHSTSVAPPRGQPSHEREPKLLPLFPLHSSTQQSTYYGDFLQKKVFARRWD